MKLKFLYNNKVLFSVFNYYIKYTFIILHSHHIYINSKNGKKEKKKKKKNQKHYNYYNLIEKKIYIYIKFKYINILLQSTNY